MIDAVILTCNSRDLALECVEHTTADSRVSRVIVVDNASTDDTVARVELQYPDAVVVALPTHTGLSAALNAGASNGDSPFVLYLNDDVYAQPGAIGMLLAALEADPTAVAAGGRLVNDDLSTQDQYRPRDFPNALTIALRLVGLERFWPRNPITGRHLRTLLDDETIVAVDQPAGACLLVRRDAVIAVGGWNEQYWFWYEDVDFSRKLAERGSSLYVPRAAFRHVGGATTKRWSLAEMHRRTFYGMLVYARNHCSRAGQWLVGITLAITSSCRYLGLRVRREPGVEVYRSAIVASRDLLFQRPIRRNDG